MIGCWGLLGRCVVVGGVQGCYVVVGVLLVISMAVMGVNKVYKTVI